MRYPISPSPPVSEFGAPTMISGSSARTSAGIATDVAPAITPFSPVLGVMYSSQPPPCGYGRPHPQKSAPYEVRILQHVAAARQYDVAIGENDPARRELQASRVLLNEQNRRALPLNLRQAF